MRMEGGTHQNLVLKLRAGIYKLHDDARFALLQSLSGLLLGILASLLLTFVVHSSPLAKCVIFFELQLHRELLTSAFVSSLICEQVRRRTLLELEDPIDTV